MGSVLDFCQPRPELLAGNFNPEIFTASLSPIIEHYRGNKSSLDRIYTDATHFLKKGLTPPRVCGQLWSEVFGRLSGDVNCLPFIV